MKPGMLVVVAAAGGMLLGASAARAQDSTSGTSVRPELGIAVGGAFPQGNFTRDVDAGLDAYARLAIPIKPSSGFSIIAMGSYTDFKAQDKGAILDSTGQVTSAEQQVDYRAPQAHLGFQWTGAWEPLHIRPRVALSGGAHFVETESIVRVAGQQIDALTQVENQTCFGLRLQLGSDLVLRNNVALTVEFALDHVFNVLQYGTSDGTNPAATNTKSVAYLSILGGLAIPFL